MSKGNTFENDIVALIFNGTAISNIADNASSSPLASLYLSLHTGDPGEAGNQTTNEAAYTSYARVAVARNSSGFTVSGNSASLTSTVVFPEATGGSETLTHAGIGTASSGAGKLLYKGALSANIVVTSGITPKLTAGSSVTED